MQSWFGCRMGPVGLVGFLVPGSVSMGSPACRAQTCFGGKSWGVAWGSLRLFGADGPVRGLETSRELRMIAF